MAFSKRTILSKICDWAKGTFRIASLLLSTSAATCMPVVKFYCYQIVVKHHAVLRSAKFSFQVFSTQSIKGVSQHTLESFYEIDRFQPNLSPFSQYQFILCRHSKRRKRTSPRFPNSYKWFWDGPTLTYTVGFLKVRMSFCGTGQCRYENRFKSGKKQTVSSG